MRKKCGAWLVVATLTGLTPVSAAEQSTGTVLRSIQTVEEDGMTLVTINADGPLPLPTSHSLDGPPRIYLDLAGVTPEIKGSTAGAGGGVVRRARVALYSVSPNVTRVVLDLTRRESYRVNTDERQAGRIRILVGSGSGPIPPAPAAHERIPSPAAPVSANPIPESLPTAAIGIPTPAVPAGSSTTGAEAGSGTVTRVPAPAPAPPRPVRSPLLSPQVPPRPGLPAREVEVYRHQLSGVLERMELRRSLIASIDAEEGVGAEALALAVQEFNDLRRILEAIKPSSVLRSTHDLLITSCTLGAMASSLRIEAARENSLEAWRNAASAAAGSLMLFDRACADLGCTRAPR